jgi:hypothetical protein
MDVDFLPKCHLCINVIFLQDNVLFTNTHTHKSIASSSSGGEEKLLSSPPGFKSHL